MSTFPLSPVSEEPINVDATSTVSRARANAVLITLSVTAFMLVTSETMPFGLLKVMAADLDKSQSQIGLLVLGHGAVVAMVSIPLALLTTRIPRRLLLTLTMLVWVCGTLLAANADDYTALFLSRLVTAFAQAMFWTVVAATVAGLFPLNVRGKVVSRLLIGPAAAAVLGLPAATWLGQQEGWRAPFLVVSAVGAALAFAIWFLVPHYKPSDGSASRGSAPHRRRFVILMGITLFGLLGLMTVYTYISAFLTEVSGFSDAALPALLTSSGAVGIVTMFVVGRYLDRFPRGAIATGLSIFVIAWGGMALVGSNKIASVILFLLVGVGFSTMVAALMNRVMQLSPGSTDLGVAIYGTMYNLGIVFGSLVGGIVIDTIGPAALPVTGLAAVLVALGLLGLSNRWSQSRASRA